MEFIFGLRIGISGTKWRDKDSTMAGAIWDEIKGTVLFRGIFSAWP